MFDMKEYLTRKADKAGLTLMEVDATINQDSRNFLLVGGTAARARQPISISGLEEVQNGSEAAIKDLLDARFAKALQALDGKMK